MLHPDDRDDPLLWLSLVLWPDGRTAVGGASADRSAGHRTVRGRWWASPSLDRPQILIPADAPAAARRAVRRYHDGFDTARRLRSLAAEAMMVLPPVADRLLRAKEVTATADDQAGSGIIEGLAGLLDAPGLVVAASLSIPKSNRKPVLQLLDPDGRCLGWAKVAWNPISEGLVANEARWLDRPGDGSLIVPRLLHDVELCGRRVVVTSSVEAVRRPHRRRDALPPAGVFRAVAARGRRDVEAIDRTPWWYSVEAVLDHASEVERAAIESTIDDCRRLRFDVGAWHGDLTPWNLMTTGQGVQLIDWELAADGVPFGFDLCHFNTQVATELKGLPAAAALDRSARLSPQGLAWLGVDPRNRSALWRLYLVELLRRQLALRRQGYPDDRLHLGPAALARLTAATGMVGTGAVRGRGRRSEDRPSGDEQAPGDDATDDTVAPDPQEVER